MDTVVICIVAFLASGLTLFSGFGLGTLLLPAFLFFFPPQLAVAMTAVVHFLNNLFKLALLGKKADRGIVLRFGLPALIASFAGAGVLLLASSFPAVYTYELFGRFCEVSPVKLLVGPLVILFGAAELGPGEGKFRIEKRHLALGGVLSGFFGGLSGHQGALRSAFLVRAGMEPEAFIATGVVIACLVDVTRLGVYAAHVEAAGLGGQAGFVAAATAAAFAGIVLARKLLRAVTVRGIRLVVAVLLLLVGLGLASGVL